jgi:predicted ATPase with chaperone activity
MRFQYLKISFSLHKHHCPELLGLPKLPQGQRLEVSTNCIASEKKMYDEVQQALTRQKERSKESGIFWNARYELIDIEKHFFVKDDAQSQIQAAVRKYGASERGRMMVAKFLFTTQAPLS